MSVLVTGAAGFIGYHVTQTLLSRGDNVVGLDIVNNYYDVSLKEARLAGLIAMARGEGAGQFTVLRQDIAESGTVAAAIADHKVDRVIHLAAQAGVRHSLTHPHDYAQANIIGFLNVLEACRHARVTHLTYASTSSVYGLSRALPFQEGEDADHPTQFYAATKRANELMAHSYSHLFDLPTTGLRFFTVYGPWGRPDMALFHFTAKILAGEPIPVFGHGAQTRDFTYVDDIAAGVVAASDRPATPDLAFDPTAPDPGTSSAPFRLYNIGNNRPVALTAYIDALEAALGVRARRELLPMQPGDVPDTQADVTRLSQIVGYAPETPVEVGVSRFVDWYREYYGVPATVAVPVTV